MQARCPEVSRHNHEVCSHPSEEAKAECYQAAYRLRLPDRRHLPAMRWHGQGMPVLSRGVFVHRSRRLRPAAAVLHVEV